VVGEDLAILRAALQPRAPRAQCCSVLTARGGERFDHRVITRRSASVSRRQPRGRERNLRGNVGGLGVGDLRTVAVRPRRRRSASGTSPRTRRPQAAGCRSGARGLDLAELRPRSMSGRARRRSRACSSGQARQLVRRPSRYRRSQLDGHADPAGDRQLLPDPCPREARSAPTAGSAPLLAHVLLGHGDRQTPSCARSMPRGASARSARLPARCGGARDAGSTSSSEAGDGAPPPGIPRRCAPRELASRRRSPTSARSSSPAPPPARRGRRPPELPEGEPRRLLAVPGSSAPRAP
jgi:hypothetical protein